MFVHFYSSANGGKIPQNNTVMVIGTNFTNNSATKAGGGADIGYSALHTLAVPVKNQIVFSDCRFVENRASYGGGTALFASYGETKAQETITFENCVWSSNVALFSPAVDISPFALDSRRQGFHLEPVFADCMFTANTIQYDWENGDKSATKYVNTGSFMVNEFTVKFEGQIIFSNNKYSALKLSSGVVIFRNGANVQFVNNTGIKGGAIALYGASSIHVDDNSQFEFIGNHATEVGVQYTTNTTTSTSRPASFSMLVGPMTALWPIARISYLTSQITLLILANRCLRQHFINATLNMTQIQ